MEEDSPIALSRRDVHELCGSLRTCPKAVVPASELVSTESYFSLAPLVVGILIAALATVWRRGVQLSEEWKGSCDLGPWGPWSRSRPRRPFWPGRWRQSPHYPLPRIWGHDWPGIGGKE